VNNRQKEIVKILTATHKVKIGELAERMQVSDETIRRDLKQLESQHLLRRVHGGAISDTNRSKEIDLSSRKSKNLKEKRAIAKMAASFVEDGDSLAIASGTTTLELVKALENKKNLTIITNSIDAAVAAMENESTTVYILGGKVRRNGLSISGTLTNELMSEFRVDKLFFCGGGISVENGITDYHVEESMLTKTMARVSRTKIALMDYSKFALTGMKKICDIQDLDIIVIDGNVPIIEQNELKATGVKVAVAY